jgi:hypothetical protein
VNIAPDAGAIPTQARASSIVNLILVSVGAFCAFFGGVYSQFQRWTTTNVCSFVRGTTDRYFTPGQAAQPIDLFRRQAVADGLHTFGDRRRTRFFLAILMAVLEIVLGAA